MPNEPLPPLTHLTDAMATFLTDEELLAAFSALRANQDDEHAQAIRGEMKRRGLTA